MARLTPFISSPGRISAKHTMRQHVSMKLELMATKPRKIAVTVTRGSMSAAYASIEYSGPDKPVVGLME